MSRRKLTAVYGLVSILLLMVYAAQASAYVNPVRGGGQRPNTDAPMIMPYITFVGTDIVVKKDTVGNDWQTLTGNDRPVMWPLKGTDAFDPAKSWYNALNGKAYNWQYGWSNAAFNQNVLPADSNVFIEVISQSAGLNAYDRTMNSYTQILGTVGAIWKWNDDMSMAHNAYAVTPAYAEWSATYKIYVGNSITGAELAGFGSDTVTLTWTSVPEPATMGLLGVGAVYLLGKKRRKD